MTKEIPLTQGKVALVDDEDYDWLMKYKWWIHSGGYAIRQAGRTDVYMHRAIWEMHHGTLPKGMGIDHIDHNKLNNCLKNIRTATSSQNNHNQSKRKTSEFKGITYDPRDDVWVAQTLVSGKHKIFGRFKNKEEAARAYDAGARHFFGDYACVNFPDEVIPYIPRIKRTNSSKYPGVSWKERNHAWYARKSVGNGKRVSIGYFKTEEEAYDAIVKWTKEHARSENTNTPPDNI